MRRLGAAPSVLLLVALIAVAVAAPAGAQRRGVGIPPHPSQLRFEDVRFTVPAADPYRHELPGGIAVYVVEDHTLPLVEVSVALRAGEYLDPVEQAGLASLAAALMRRGGAGDLSAEAFDERADFLAARISAGAGSLRAGASLDAPSWVLPEALDLFFHMLRRPRFESGPLEVAKSNLLAAMEAGNDEPLAVLDREWNHLLYGESHFSVRAATPASLETLTPEALASFHQRHWHPGAGMVIAVSGDVDTPSILAELTRRLAGWEAGPAPPWPPAAPQHQPAPGFYHLERDLPQAKVAVGHLGAVRSGWDDPDFYTLTVLGEILGGGAVSRIAARLRGTEGLVYRAGARLGVGDHWPGAFRIHIEAANENVALATRLALEEVERLRRQPPSADELALAKRSINRVFPLLFDTASEIAGYFAEDELLGRPHAFWSDYRKRIEAVSAADVRRAAEAHLRPDEVLILTLGRWPEIEAGDPGRRATSSDFYDGSVHFLSERELRPRH